MLLHMLNGRHPWVRYYSHPLCLQVGTPAYGYSPTGLINPDMLSVCQIVNEPPPLWEVPSNCNNFTAKVFRAGLQKDPERRASARELRRKTTKALRAGRCSANRRITKMADRTVRKLKQLKLRGSGL